MLFLLGPLTPQERVSLSTLSSHTLHRFLFLLLLLHFFCPHAAPLPQLARFGLLFLAVHVLRLFHQLCGLRKRNVRHLMAALAACNAVLLLWFLREVAKDALVPTVLFGLEAADLCPQVLITKRAWAARLRVLIQLAFTFACIRLFSVRVHLMVAVYASVRAAIAKARSLVQRAAVRRRYKRYTDIVERLPLGAGGCAICREEGELRVLKCSHGFHSSCLVGWVVSGGCCPLCRGNIFEESL